MKPSDDVLPGDILKTTSLTAPGTSNYFQCVAVIEGKPQFVELHGMTDAAYDRSIRVEAALTQHNRSDKTQ